MKEKESEKMSLYMRTLKAVHGAFTNPKAVSPEELAKQRAEMEIFSRLITPTIGVSTKSFKVGEIPCEEISPDFSYREDRIILYCHGGGYTCGGLNYARILASKLSLHTGLKVFSFEYGLAPEHKYPQAIDEAVSVYDYLLNKGYGAKNIVIAGDSAGGNLTLEICIRLIEQERFLPKALVLFSPWTDMRAVNPSYETLKDKDPLLTREYVESVRSAYTNEGDDFEDPHLSPLLYDFKNMPPVLIQVGSNEILRDDSEKLVKKLTKSGSFARLQIIQGGWHVFQQMPIVKANKALKDVDKFLKEI